MSYSSLTKPVLDSTDAMSQALKLRHVYYTERCYKVSLQYDNTQPRVATIIKESLEEFRWKVSRHKEAKNWVDYWITSKYHKCFQCSICMLPERWAKFIANDGQYFE